MPEWMKEKETNGIFENDVCRVLGGKFAEVEKRRMGEIDLLRKELLAQEDQEQRNSIYEALRILRDELNCLRAIA